MDVVRPEEVDWSGQLDLSGYIHRISAANQNIQTRFGMSRSYADQNRIGFSTFEFQLSLPGTHLRSGEAQQVLFSICVLIAGVSGWLPAIPDHENCKRNCNDCAVHTGEVHDDGSTGTQCKVFIPRYANQVLRMRVRRVEDGAVNDEAQRERYRGVVERGHYETTTLRGERTKSEGLPARESRAARAVSYTHLTLPTLLLV